GESYSISNQKKLLEDYCREKGWTRFRHFTDDGISGTTFESSNMAKSGMNPKTLQYLMGHSDISVTMNVYTHIGFDDAEEELKRMEEFRKAQAEIEKKTDVKAVSQKMFKVV
ncbi:MAG: tyrosine-type recombinase/integrase, partial [Lachnospiraceae bacterium]|nr:tyrosine-type recombinase/integrase [Lachnospiraceae bacterium]